MNEPTTRLQVRPEISSFVEKVRARLSDLSDEEREELVGGLEADIAELVADGGSVSELGDPRAYADELRAAAGVERQPGPSTGSSDGLFDLRRRPHRAVGEAISARLDAVRDWWLALVHTPGLRGAWEMVASLRPVWWVLRAWLAVELLVLFVGYGGRGLDVIPSFGPRFGGGVLLVLAVVLSVQMGRGKVWPGRGHRGSPWSRVLLLSLNALAVAVLSLVVGSLPTWQNVSIAFDDGYTAGSGGSGGGLVYQGDSVQNVFPYDAQGRPLTGVQLFDQDGRPLRLDRTSEYLGWDDRLGDRWSVSYPWMNGGQQLYNVVPLATRDQQRSGRPGSAWLSENPPALPTPPLAVVPPASLPTSDADETTTGEAETDATGAEAGAEGSATETSVTKADEPAEGGGKSGKRDSEKTTGR